MANELAELIRLFSAGLPIRGDATEHATGAGELADLVRALSEGTPIGRPSTPADKPTPGAVRKSRGNNMWLDDGGPARLVRLKEVARQAAQDALVKMSAARVSEDARLAALKELLGGEDYAKILPYIAKAKTRPSIK